MTDDGIVSEIVFLQQMDQKLRERRKWRGCVDAFVLHPDREYKGRNFESVAYIGVCACVRLCARVREDC